MKFRYLAMKSSLKEQELVQFLSDVSAAMFINEPVENLYVNYETSCYWVGNKLTTAMHFTHLSRKRDVNTG